MYDWDLGPAMQYRANDMDPALSTLIDDIYARGLDRKIVVIAMGEFGRTPRISPRLGLARTRPLAGGHVGPGVRRRLADGPGDRRDQLEGRVSQSSGRSRPKTCWPPCIATWASTLSTSSSTSLAARSGFSTTVRRSPNCFDQPCSKQISPRTHNNRAEEDCSRPHLHRRKTRRGVTCAALAAWSRRSPTSRVRTASQMPPNTPKAQPAWPSAKR